MSSSPVAWTAQSFCQQRAPGFDKVDHVIFVAASKGVADLLTYMLHDGSRASAQSRAKVRGIVSLSGVVRGSNMAQ
jgi:hypothetical protein